MGRRWRRALVRRWCRLRRHRGDIAGGLMVAIEVAILAFLIWAQASL